MTAPAILHFRNCRGIATITGPERYLLSLFSGVDPSEFDLHLLCLLNPNAPQSVFNEDFWSRHSASRHPLHIHEMPSAFSRSDAIELKSLIRQHDVRVVATHDARSNVMGLGIARRMGIPRIAFAHGWVNWERRLSKAYLYAELEAAFVRQADLVMVASAAMKRDLMRRGIAESKIRHVPYGQDTSLFTTEGGRGTLRADLGIPEDAPLVGNVARLQPWKGHRYLLEAAAEIHRRRPDVHFVIVGGITIEEDKGYRDELIGYRDRLGLGGVFHFAGTRTDMPEVMRALDVFVLSSTHEPFGLVLLEAQASGTPPVSFAVDGTPEVIEDGVTGLLVPPGNSRELGERTLELLDDPNRRKEMGHAGRQRVVDQFSIPAMARRTMCIYGELIAMSR